MGWRAKHRRFGRRHRHDPHCARCRAIAHDVPLPGQFYRVRHGDTLTSIVRAAYPNATPPVRLLLTRKLASGALWPVYGGFGSVRVPDESEAARARRRELEQLGRDAFRDLLGRLL